MKSSLFEKKKLKRKLEFNIILIVNCHYKYRKIRKNKSKMEFYDKGLRTTITRGFPNKEVYTSGIYNLNRIPLGRSWFSFF